MNGYAKFSENNGDHTIQPASLTLEETRRKDSNHSPEIHPREPTMKSENFMLKRNHTSTSQRFATSNNSDLKNMMRRAFSTRKAYWRIEDDTQNGEVGERDFVHEHEMNKDETRGNGETDKKKKKSFKRWKKIFHF